MRRYLSRAHELLSCAHDIISQSENTECCLKVADSINDINIMLYFDAECRYQSILTLLGIDTFQPSKLFTLVNNNTSIVNTPFFSWCHLIRRKVVHYSSFVVNLDIHQLRYIVFDMMQ